MFQPVRHDARYPAPKELLKRTVVGYDDTDDAVVDHCEVDRSDPRPLWYSDWEPTTELAKTTSGGRWIGYGASGEKKATLRSSAASGSARPTSLASTPPS
jgi:hypothetical protein